MKLQPEVTDILLNADGKALATFSSDTGINVVPVSSIKIENDQIILVNYFFRQSLKNIMDNPQVSLAAWKGLEGFQIKATGEHLTEGSQFDEVVKWVAQTLPDRVVKGIIVLTPTAVFNVSANSDLAGTAVVT